VAAKQITWFMVRILPRAYYESSIWGAFFDYFCENFASMRITIELSSVTEFEKIMAVLTAMGLPTVSISAPKQTKRKPANLEPGDKSLDPEALFGIWKDAPRDLKTIREQGWNRNWAKS
jgi:hypothetical protein